MSKREIDINQFEKEVNTLIKSTTHAALLITSIIHGLHEKQTAETIEDSMSVFVRAEALALVIMFVLINIREYYEEFVESMETLVLKSSVNQLFSDSMSPPKEMNLDPITILPTYTEDIVIRCADVVANVYFKCDRFMGNINEGEDVYVEGSVFIVFIKIIESLLKNRIDFSHEDKVKDAIFAAVTDDSNNIRRSLHNAYKFHVSLKG